ncbi:HNH endonuclease [Paramicrobacterium humi]|uniref:HNH endonuclease n=1 Tax=Paramicrobacterium humi TaxID=640635 RepID=A0A1H4N8N3_9MICO|nr:HNH endonuclease signature motif containing protein [Microbacterium humi]SEB90952.1 HNH endonuclease [Microbacterium humi]
MEFEDESRGRPPDPDGPGRRADRLSGLVDRLVAQQASISRAQAKMTGQLVNILETALSDPDVFTESTRGDSRTVEQVRRSLRSELALALHLSEGRVQSLLDTAEVLVADFPDTLRSLKAGRISLPHAECIVRESTGLDRDDLAVFEEAVLEYAETSTPSQLKAQAIRIREGLAPESITERHTSALEERRLEVWKGHDGMGWLACYDRIEIVQSLYNASHATAKSLRKAGDERTVAQLTVDSFVDAAMTGFVSGTDPADDDAATGPALAGRMGAIRPTVHVTVPVFTLMGLSDEPADLEGYGPIDPETARRLAAQAPSFTRLLTNPETGAVLSVGRDRYQVPADLRKAIEIRDVTCRFPGCNRSARQCDLDHVVDWQFGGETDLDNCQATCRAHHTLKHATRWAVERDPMGNVIWTSPLGRSYRIRTESKVGFEPLDRDRPVDDHEIADLVGADPDEPVDATTTDDEKWADEYPENPEF